ncbi:phage tail protein [Kluyvera ascorbata]|uniref:phage tail protein n=1 Tax=Kluyvera ascorbata TaxID=51288 RepID=UPI001FECFA2E|nr:phage tail protein [Kluyvera ascorbata]
MSTKYKTVITTAGAAKLAAATVPGGKKVNITAMAVGDGGGTLPEPNDSQTKLINEVWRYALNKISQDNKKKNYIVAELVIPPEVGGFWMRELGLYDDAGTLIAVANMAESYKPKLEEGSGRAQTCRMVIIVSSIESVDLTIDSTTVMATQEYVDDKLSEHEQSRRHPDATLKEKGFTQLSSATDSTSEVLAATPKAVKAAYDLANAKYTAVDATTSRKGIVQLSSATDSTSEVLAATPKAVKAANDNANGRVPSTRKVNGHALSSDISLSFDDVGALSAEVLGVIRDGMTMASANKPGWWQVAVANTATVSDFPKYPDGSRLYGYGYLFVDMTANSWLQHYYNHRGVNAKRQDWNVGPTESIPWIIDFNTANIPTAADVDAVSSKNGGRYYAKVEFGSVVIFEKSYPGLTLRDNDSADSFVGKDLTIESSKGNVHLLWRKKDSTDGQVKLDFPKVNGTIYSTGNKPSAGDVGAYTKAEADARFVSDVQLGAGTKVTTYNIAGNWPNRSGYVITSVFKDLNDYNLDGIHYAPLQKKIGTTWYTVSGGTV